jgi:hypothetical protein
MFIHEPPMRIEEARAPIDEIAGTGVDTLVYGFAGGGSMFHLTKVGEVWGSRIETFNDLGPSMPSVPFWRAYENIQSLKKQGLDVLSVLADRAQEKGIELFGSLRMGYGCNPEQADSPFQSQFALDHPQFVIGKKGSGPFDYAHAHVRAERFALIEEAVTCYDLDGFELAFDYPMTFFEPDKLEKGRVIMTEFIGHIREMADEAQDKRGRPIALGVRVPPTESANLGSGLDVRTWIADGLLDFVVPNVYGHDAQQDGDLPFDWLLEAARSTDCSVYPALPQQIYGASPRFGFEAGSQMADSQHYAAGAANLWRRGADGVYVPWFQWPITTEGRQILSEIHDPELLAERPKHYVVRYTASSTDARHYAAQLPAELASEKPAQRQTIRFSIADESPPPDSKLRLRINSSSFLDTLEIALNGETLDMESCLRTQHRYDYVHWDFPIPQGLLKPGRNELTVACLGRPDKLEGTLTLEGVEIVLDYHPPQTQ